MPRWLLVTIIEIAMVLGCFTAMFVVPPTTPLKTFLWICVSIVVVFNIMLFAKLRKASSSERTIAPTTTLDRVRPWILTGLMLLYLLWQVLKRWK
jgi:hypothetical protein